MSNSCYSKISLIELHSIYFSEFTSAQATTLNMVKLSFVSKTGPLPEFFSRLIQ
ncbi:hypothetical protein BCR33DRAFT_727957 [Rhizoclosmatium globosum]|uniref:Uncharacterized protein n=1 Tax=Rhizoclosmatium globosum TaxID=329046 RepID=A0A1Y2AH72_9FUNG|nr:hypothetical protein BCR33DRAFT_729477 [Rhizoclosmatium globosum]ORY23641.1 hypothetical protein BCR33DRAFT_727957 [Rhizoclosmatium globosum]|eukprot:ORY21325.1 hypothetical protein BCR33DRAFT_729477 [Rhizoclosmatium globosum]